jgi:hypothetical protein
VAVYPREFRRGLHDVTSEYWLLLTESGLTRRLPLVDFEVE